MHLVKLAKNLFILTFFYASTAAAQYCYDPINNFYYDCGASNQVGSAVFFNIMIPSYSGYNNRTWNNDWSGSNRHHYRSWDDRNKSNWDRRNEMWQGGWQGNNWHQNQHRNWNNQNNQWQNRQQHNWQNRQRNWHH